jgi:hypothetical protein
MSSLCPGFSQLRRLGEGGFGVVYLAEQQSDEAVGTAHGDPLPPSLNSGPSNTRYDPVTALRYKGCQTLQHDRSKHIHIRQHFLREKVLDNTVELSHVATHDNLADALTKPLSYHLFEGLRHRIGVTSRPNQSRPTTGGHGDPQPTLDATSASTDSRERDF